jgi:aryl-alcohol dehydrogenase-like predicted oxidoreductase
MELREFGRLGRVSALTLGGGGIAGVWGDTDRAEAVATVHAALDAGITMLDVAPVYGTDFESERAAGEALRSRPGADPLITSKVVVSEDDGDVAAIVRDGLRDSLDRLGRDHLDLFLLHSQMRPRDGSLRPRGTIGWRAYRDEVVPEFERLRAEGLIRAWGITGIAHPDSVLAALREEPRPDAAQVVVNALDMSGDLWAFDGVAPANEQIRAAAVENGVPVIAIRAVAAGSLTGALDRTVPPGHPAAVDFARAASFRKAAAELGETPAALAHRYALTVPGVATVVLGVKNRAELDECVAAEARGPLTADEMRAVGG